MYKSGVHWYVTVTLTLLYCDPRLRSGSGHLGARIPVGPYPAPADLGAQLDLIAQVCGVETDRHRQNGIIVDVCCRGGQAAVDRGVAGPSRASVATS